MNDNQSPHTNAVDVERSTFEDEVANLPSQPTDSSQNSVDPKKRSLSDAAEEEYGSYESEEEDTQPEPVLTPEEAQRRTDELIAKMLANEGFCDDDEYVLDKYDCEEEDKLAEKEAEFYADMQVEKVKHIQTEEIKRQQILRQRQNQVQTEARENLKLLQELNKQRLIDQGKLPKEPNHTVPKITHTQKLKPEVKPIAP